MPCTISALAAARPDAEYVDSCDADFVLDGASVCANHARPMLGVMADVARGMAHAKLADDAGPRGGQGGGSGVEES